MTKKSYDELIADMTQIMAKIFEMGYEQAKFESAMGRINEIVGKETPQQKRDRIVEQAKAVVEQLEDSEVIRCRVVDYVINKEKRTVVALLRGIYDGEKVQGRGIAKCAPGDCFNVHIGKAIALRRALGLEVPDEYLNAPQPTEVRVGDVVSWGNPEHTYEIEAGNRVINIQSGRDCTAFADMNYAEIIDDSREQAL